MLPPRRKPLTQSQRLARKILEVFFEFCFAPMNSLRYSQALTIDRPMVIATFHDEMIPATGLLKGQKITAIASRNHNGYSVAQVIIRKSGFGMAYGSTTKGGKEAFNELNSVLQQGESVVLSVDGSRGPRHEMKPGAIMLAKKNKVPLVLLRLKTRGLRLPTWDRFLIPLPFCRVKVSYEILDFSADEKRSVKALLPIANEKLRHLADA